MERGSGTPDAGLASGVLQFGRQFSVGVFSTRSTISRSTGAFRFSSSRPSPGDEIE
jgi:hypothetical protein